MFGSSHSIFGTRANPIGVDFGSDCLRMAQVSQVDGEPQLIAAASAEVPPSVRHNAAARLTFFAETAKQLLTQGAFVGRAAVLGLPASVMSLVHLRVPRMDDQALKQAIPWEARGKLPMDVEQAILRHHVVGEIFHETEPQIEVIVMAAAREWVNRFLDAAAKAKLDVTGMAVEPTTIVECFGHIYRRQTDAACVNCFVDIGGCGTRVVIAQGPHILFARSIAVSGEHLNRAVATALSIPLEDAKLLRVCLAQAQALVADSRPRADLTEAPPPFRGAESEIQPDGRALLRVAERAVGQRQRAGESAGVAVAEPSLASHVDAQAPRAGIDRPQQEAAVEEACRPLVDQLLGELELCRRYYETAFPAKPIERLIFIGGEARQRGMCQQIAQGMGLAAQVGDPLVRMNRTTKVGLESGLDRREPQPAWTMAVGLSLGLRKGSKSSQ